MKNIPVYAFDYILPVSGTGVICNDRAYTICPIHILNNITDLKNIKEEYFKHFPNCKKVNVFWIFKEEHDLMITQHTKRIEDEQLIYSPDWYRE